jgi:hypothetical protein
LVAFSFRHLFSGCLLARVFVHEALRRDIRGASTFFKPRASFVSGALRSYGMSPAFSFNPACKAVFSFEFGDMGEIFKFL